MSKRRKIKTLPIPKNIDKVINALVSLGAGRPGKMLTLDPEDVQQIILKAKEIFMKQPNLLELNPPLNVLGDTHGDLNNLVQILELGGHPRLNNYLFLGDYADRGEYGLEVLLLLFCFKIKRPENFFLLRGNHESRSVTKRYGFEAECFQKQSPKIYRLFVAAFNCMPPAALIADQIFCMHGGISPHIQNMDQVRNMRRPTEIPDAGILADLTWADPTHQIEGWAPNAGRGGISFVFGKKALREFMAKHKLSLIIRAHQVVEDGYLFFDNQRLLTLFSAPNYTNSYDNKAGILKISPRLELSIKTMKAPKAEARMIWTRLS